MKTYVVGTQIFLLSTTTYVFIEKKEKKNYMDSPSYLELCSYNISAGFQSELLKISIFLSI